MNLLLPDRFDDPGTGYAYTRTIFEEVAGGGPYGDRRGPRPGRHLGVTRRDTLRPGFDEAVRAAYEEDYPVLVRAAGGGAIAAGRGTFGFSIIRPAEGHTTGPEKEVRRGRCPGARGLLSLGRQRRGRRGP